MIKVTLGITRRGYNYIWVVRPDHTQEKPKVELFSSAPLGSEPTGLTFSPDYRFAFVSIQHPSNTNGQQNDATLEGVSFQPLLYYRIRKKRASWTTKTEN